MNVVFARSSNIYDDSRATKEIFTLLEEGYNVSVLGWNRDGNALDQCRMVFKEYSHFINFRFFRDNEGKGKINKILKRIKWSQWLKNNLQQIEDIDIIHSCDFDTGYVVRDFAKRNNVKYIYDIFDYYVDAHPVPSLIRHYTERNEIAVINDAEVCIICTEERREQIGKATPKSVLVIYNSPEVQASNAVEQTNDYVYCGSMYGGRLLSEILTDYEKHAHYKFSVAGYGEFAGLAKSLGEKFDNFSYLGTVPYAEVLDIESKSKVISAIYDPSIRNHRLCAPNKFYEAMALGKPIIVCKGTGIDKIVEDNKIGIVISYSSEEFYSALDYLINNPSESEQMGKRARTLYEREYQWHLMKDKLLRSYEQIIGSANSSWE